MNKRKIVTMMALGIIGCQSLNVLEVSASPTTILEEGIKEQRSHMNETKGDLEKLQEEIESTETSIQEVAEEMVPLLENIKIMEKRTKKKEEEIKLLEEEVKENKKKAEILYKKSKSRLIALQQTQTSTTVAIIQSILTSDNIVEMIERTANAKKIFNAGNDLMEEYNKIVEILEEQEEKLIEEKEELTKEKETLKEKQNELVEKRKDAEKKYAELKEKKTKLQDDYGIQISDLAELEKLLKEHEKRAKEKAEILAQEQEKVLAPVQEGRQSQGMSLTQSFSQNATLSSASYLTLDLRTQTPITAKEIDNYISEKIGSKASKLSGSGQVFIDVGNKYGVNALYLVAHAIHESAFGTSKIALDKNNFFGYGAYDSNPYNGAFSFASVEEGIALVAKKIKNTYLKDGHYLNKGTYLGDKTSGMNYYYASDSDWGRKIASIMDDIHPFDATEYAFAEIRK